MDDEELDPVYQPDADEEEPEEAKDQPGVSLSQAESISQGIPQLPQKKEGCKRRKLEIPLQGLQQKISKDI